MRDFINADHTHMCKFEGPGDQEYGKVYKHIAELVEAANKHSTQSVI